MRHFALMGGSAVKRHCHLIILTLVLMFLTTEPAYTATTYNFQKIAGGFKSPVAIVQAPDDKTRLFIPELAGTIRVIKDGKLLAQPFLDLTAIVTTEIFGQGLFNIAFHPDYAHNGFFYVLYTDLQGDPVVARYSVSSANPDQADPASAKILL